MQEEYNTERFKIAQANAASFRKQSQILEERNAKLNGIVAKHEESSETMRAETMGLQTRLSQVRPLRVSDHNLGQSSGRPKQIYC